METTRKFAPTEEEMKKAHEKTVHQLKRTYLKNLSTKKESLFKQTQQPGYFDEMPLLRKYQQKISASDTPKQSIPNQPTINNTNNNATNSENTETKTLISETHHSDEYSIKDMTEEKEIEELLSKLEEPSMPKILKIYKDYLNQLFIKIKEYFLN